MLIRVSISFWFIIITTLKLSSVGETTIAVSFEMEEEESTRQLWRQQVPWYHMRWESGVPSRKLPVQLQSRDCAPSQGGHVCLWHSRQWESRGAACVRGSISPSLLSPWYPPPPTRPASVIPSTLDVCASHFILPTDSFLRDRNSHAKNSVQDWGKEDPQLSQHGPLISGSRREWVSRWKLPCPAQYYGAA